jgi:hypothetical protein
MLIVVNSASALLLCCCLCLGCIPYLASWFKDCEHKCGTVVRYWQSGIDRDVRRLWRTVGHKELGDFGRKEFGVRM